MLGEHEQMDPERLCDAAQAALLAAAEVSQQTGGKWPYPADLLGTPMQPRCLAAFSRWEMEQACEFLVRLGMLEPRAKPDVGANQKRDRRSA